MFSSEGSLWSLDREIVILNVIGFITVTIFDYCFQDNSKFQL